MSAPGRRFRGADQAGVVGGDDQLGAIARLQLHEQAADVGLGGGQADVQVGCDLGIGQAEPDQGQDLALPFGYVIPRDYRARLGFGAPGELRDKTPGDPGGEQRVAGRDHPDRGQQVGRRGVFQQEAAGAPAQRGEDVLVQEMKSNSIYPALYFLGAGLLWVLPAIIGLFWGAPLVTRELEAGTFRLAWNQSVTRARWMAVKLALTGLVAMATAGLLSLMITWWASPIDQAGGFPISLGQLGRFSPQLFAARGITPIGYAAFAFALGVTAGVLIRRTVPAMAITLAFFAAVQVITPTWIRPHLIPAAHATAAININLNDAIVTHSVEMIMPVTNLPGAWIISNQTIATSGHVFVLPATGPCAGGSTQACNAWLPTQHLRRAIPYQPASRYWALQRYETAIFLALAVALAGFCIWWIRHRRLS